MHIKLTNGTSETYTIGQLRRDNPQISFPKNIPNELLANYGVYPVKVLPMPDYDEKTHYLKQSDYYQVEGNWQVHYYPVELSESQAIENIRNHRNTLLFESDWTQVSDAPVDQSVWAAYRQELRDITLQNGCPFNILWPDAPE
jgi:hypothetical protein